MILKNVTCEYDLIQVVLNVVNNTEKGRRDNMSIHSDMKKGIFSPVYLMYGGESFFIDETIQLIIKQAVDEKDIEFNVSMYEAEEVSIDGALEDATTPPFFGERKVVIVRSASFLTGQKAKIEQNIKGLEKYIESPSPFTIFIVVAPYEKLDERKKITKLLKKQAVVESQTLDENKMKQWILNKAQESGITITEQAVQLLIELIGMNVTVLSNEMEKLAVFAGEQGTITDDIVMLLVPKSAEQNVFMLVENVISRNIPKALEILDELLYRQEEPIKILGLLASQFRLLYQVKEYMQVGYTQQQIASRVGVHPYRVKLAGQKVRGFSLEELYQIMEELAEADYKMKTSGLDKKLVLEFFIMKRKM